MARVPFPKVLPTLEYVTKVYYTYKDGQGRPQAGRSRGYLTENAQSQLGITRGLERLGTRYTER